jgi:hypothetical protein
VSTLMTERRRPLENDDGQESLFGGEAFAPAPARTPASWERPAPARGEEEAAEPPTGADFQARESAPSTDAPAAHGFEADVSAPRDQAQGAAEHEGGPSIEDPAAYGFEEASAPRSGAPDASEMLAGATPTEVPVHDAGDELDALERATVAADDVRRPRVPLAGPTLDDVMSRVWEGLVTGLPAACPVCHGEVVPSAHGSLRGRCSSCGTTID